MNYKQFYTTPGSAETIRIEVETIGVDQWPVPIGESDEVSIKIGLGDDPSTGFEPAAEFAAEFDAASPVVVGTWPGSATEGLDPAEYVIWLTIEGATRRAGILLVDAASTTGSHAPIIGIAEAREITGGSIDQLERDAGDILRALRSSSDELRTNLAKRWAAGRPDRLAGARTAILAPEAGEAIARSDAARRFVAYRAMYHLLFVLGTSDSSKMYERLRTEAMNEASRSLGRIMIDIPGLGLISMSSNGANLIR